MGDFYNYVTHCDSMSNLEWMVEAFPGSLLSMFIQSIDISDNNTLSYIILILNSTTMNCIKSEKEKKKRNHVVSILTNYYI